MLDYGGQELVHLRGNKVSMCFLVFKSCTSQRRLSKSARRAASSLMMQVKLAGDAFRINHQWPVLFKLTASLRGSANPRQRTDRHRISGSWHCTGLFGLCCRLRAQTVRVRSTHQQTAGYTGNVISNQVTVFLLASGLNAPTYISHVSWCALVSVGLCVSVFVGVGLYD